MRTPIFYLSLIIALTQSVVSATRYEYTTDEKKRINAENQAYLDGSGWRTIAVSHFNDFPSNYQEVFDALDKKDIIGDKLLDMVISGTLPSPDRFDFESFGMQQCPYLFCVKQNDEGYRSIELLFAKDKAWQNKLLYKTTYHNICLALFSYSDKYLEIFRTENYTDKVDNYWMHFECYSVGQTLGGKRDLYSGSFKKAVYDSGNFNEIIDTTFPQMEIIPNLYCLIPQYCGDVLNDNNLVLKHLMPLQNYFIDNYYRPANWRGIGQFYVNGLRFLLMSEDCYPCFSKIYLLQYPKEHSYPKALLIYSGEHGGGNCQHNYFINGDTITIYTSAGSAEITAINSLRYKLDANFTPLPLSNYY